MNENAAIIPQRSLFHLAEIPPADRDHAYARIASHAAAAWEQRTAPFAAWKEDGPIVRESHAIIAALIDLLLGGQVGDDAEALAGLLIGGYYEPDAVLVEEIISAYVAEFDTGAPQLPMVRINEDAVQCPVCGTGGKIFKVAHSVQHDKL
ncbi:hypothetical protein [Actinomadura rubrisoli]|uniref:Uncharacterized protein n=1 Tax=Actinomadura rubrisoli TaxID=2530368 RepID=A0A4R5CEV1_9ACTN|nr:hypothetical protein [Actinomadura rubrisoli]TDD98105.1 hypothetical protein E1298_00095 [Actinomadura rubrisoli]